MSKRAVPTKMVSLRLPVGIYEQIEVFARHKERTVTDVIIEAISFAFSNRQKRCQATHDKANRCPECGYLHSEGLFS